MVNSKSSIGQEKGVQILICHAENACFFGIPMVGILHSPSPIPWAMDEG
jgi:hypothetical protein